MHSIAKTTPPTKPDPKEKVFEIRDLTGRVHEVRGEYFLACMRGYMLLGIGKFTVERKP